MTRAAFRARGAAVLLACLTASAGDLAAQGDPPRPEDIATWAGAGGDYARARDAVLAHVAAEGTGEDAALWVEFLAFFDRVQPAAAARGAQAVGLALDGDGLEGAELLMAGVAGATPPERPTLLALAAHLADREDEERGAEIRRTLLTAHGDAPEAGEARLLRARFLLADDESTPEGLALLEELIVTDPDHPMAPEARRLYQANGGRPSQTPAGGGTL